MGLYNKYLKLKAASAAMNETNDCTVLALAIACRKKYAEAHDALKDCGRRNRQGAFRSQQSRAVEWLGYKLIDVNVPKSATVNNTASKLTRGYYLVYVRQHVLAVHNGQVCDWTQGRRHRILKIYKVEKA